MLNLHKAADIGILTTAAERDVKQSMVFSTVMDTLPTTTITSDVVLGEYDGPSGSHGPLGKTIGSMTSSCLSSTVLHQMPPGTTSLTSSGLANVRWY